MGDFEKTYYILIAKCMVTLDVEQYIRVVVRVALDFVEEVVEIGDMRIAVAMSHLANGTLILVSDGEQRFGTIGVAVPTPFGEVSPTATSCVVGSRYTAEVRAIADIAAQKLGGIVVANLFLSRENAAQVALVLSAVRQVVMKIDPAEETGSVKGDSERL